MSAGARKVFIWLYSIATAITFIGIIGVACFEVHVRWTLNQNYAVLDGNTLASLVILFAAQMLGFVWLSRSH